MAISNYNKYNSNTEYELFIWKSQKVKNYMPDNEILFNDQVSTVGKILCYNKNIKVKSAGLYRIIIKLYSDQRK